MPKNVSVTGRPWLFAEGGGGGGLGISSDLSRKNAEATASRLRVWFNLGLGLHCLDIGRHGCRLIHLGCRPRCHLARLPRDGGNGLVIVIAVPTFVVTRLTMLAAMVIAWFALTIGGGSGFSVNALVITWLAMLAATAMVVAWFALTGRGRGRLIVVAPAMMTTLIVTRFGLTPSAAIFTRVMPATIVFAMTAFLFALSASAAVLTKIMTNPIILAMTAFAFTTTAAIVRSPIKAISSAVPANRIPDAMAPVRAAVRNVSMDGPVRYASTAPAHSHSGSAPVMRLAGAAGEEC